MLPPYSRYAAIYDRTGQHRFGAVMTELALAWLQERNIAPKSALDLATGTGAAALSLARLGITTTGIDLSEEMLAHAWEKAERIGLSVDWLQGDMRSFTLPSPVALVVCFFDSLNYLLDEDDLRRCFESVIASLRPGGWFAFDINPIHRYATDWNASTDIAYSDDQLLCLFRSNFDEETHRSPLILTVFEREADGSDLWRCWEETHIERGYPLSLVKSLLVGAGLVVEECLELDEKQMLLGVPATETSMRAVFFARRPPNGSKIRA